MGNSQIRGFGSSSSDIFILGSSGVIKTKMTTWAGTHNNIAVIGDIESPQYQEFNLQGGGQNFIPHYFGVYMWKRIS